MDNSAIVLRSALPEHGRSADEVESELKERLAFDRRAVSSIRLAKRFFGGQDVFDLTERAYGLFAQVGRSALYPGMPGGAAMEFMQRRVIDVALDLLNAPDGATGLITSGGTESAILALKACVTQARMLGVKAYEMEVVAAHTAHPCIDKAAELLNVRLLRVPATEMGTADVELMRAAVNDRTVMIYGSYPCYPYGTADDIRALATLADDVGTWLHVDACMSGFLAPFARLNGEELPDFDFAIPGVTSLSADLHKHGYSAKGASLVLFRSDAQGKHASFAYADHPLPPMRTPTLAGTAPGAPIAAAWAAMEYLGTVGYRELAQRLFAVRRAVVAAVESVRGFKVIGKPLFSLVVITSSTHDMKRVRDGLAERGWFTLPVLDPPGIHLNLGALDDHIAAELARDLTLIVENDH